MVEQQEIKSFAFMDIEATGLPQFYFGKVNITEISIHACLRKDILLSDNNKIPRNVHKLTLCFNPLRMIDPDASRVSGLYNDMLEPENSFNKNAANLILSFFQHLQHPVCLVAHNGLKFDFPILKKSLAKVGVEIPDYILCVDSYPAIKRIDEIQSAREMLNDLNGEEYIKEISNESNENEKSDDDKSDELNLEDVQVPNRNKEKTKIIDGKINEQFELEEILKYEENVFLEEITLVEEGKVIDWQKVNETTPKRKTNVKKFIKQNEDKFTNNQKFIPRPSSSSPSSGKLIRKHEYKSRRKLFSPLANKTLLTINPKKYGHYRLSTIYERIFGKKPDVMHHAEDDVITLQKIAIDYGEDFVQYADENAIKFSSVSLNGFR